jgi:hypothetical protein
LFGVSRIGVVIKVGADSGWERRVAVYAIQMRDATP